MSIDHIEIQKLEASMLAILSKLYDNDTNAAQNAQNEAFKMLEAQRVAKIPQFHRREVK